METILNRNNSPVLLDDLQFLKHHQQNNRNILWDYMSSDGLTVLLLPHPPTTTTSTPHKHTILQSFYPSMHPLTHWRTYPLPPRADLVCAALSPATWKRNDLMERKINRCVPLQTTEGLFLLLMVGAQTKQRLTVGPSEPDAERKVLDEAPLTLICGSDSPPTFDSLSLLLPPDALSSCSHTLI